MAKDWRLAHAESFQESRRWLTAAADLVVDVTACEPRAAATTILGSIGKLA